LTGTERAPYQPGDRVRLKPGLPGRPAAWSLEVMFLRRNMLDPSGWRVFCNTGDPKGDQPAWWGSAAAVEPVVN